VLHLWPHPSSRTIPLYRWVLAAAVPLVTTITLTPGLAAWLARWVTG